MKAADVLTLPLWTSSVPLGGINVKMVVPRGKTVFSQTMNGSGFLHEEFFSLRLKFCGHLSNFFWDIAFSKPHCMKKEIYGKLKLRKSA